MASSTGPRRFAFTLVELLVVIGIIALLVGILLPVLGRARGAAADLKCMSNLRTIYQLTMAYASENKGSLPYGLYYAPIPPPPTPTHDRFGYGPWNDPGNRGIFVSWNTVLDKFSRKSSARDDNVISISGGPTNRVKPTEAFQCPVAMQSYNHLLSYVANLVLFPRPGDDLEQRFGSYLSPYSNYLAKPANFSELKTPVILFHDTAVFANWENNFGFITDGDVDDQQVWLGSKDPASAHMRFVMPGNKMATNIPAMTGAPVPPDLLPSAALSFDIVDSSLTGPNGPREWENVDGRVNSTGAPSIGLQGNFRFRHAHETKTNVVYSDGHVAAMRKDELKRRDVLGPSYAAGLKRMGLYGHR